MKKMYYYTKMIVVAMIAMMAFTSCDEDTDLAYNLEGVWEGTITGNYYSYRGYTTNDYDTQIMFKQAGSWGSGGTGYETDYHRESRRYTKVFFDWTVRDGRIYLHYEDGVYVVIRDFETYWAMSRMRFRGYFDNYDTGEQLAAFNLIKVESPDDYYDGNYSRQTIEDF